MIRATNAKCCAAQWIMTESYVKVVKDLVCLGRSSKAAA